VGRGLEAVVTGGLMGLGALADLPEAAPASGIALGLEAIERGGETVRLLKPFRNDVAPGASIFREWNWAEWRGSTEGMIRQQMADADLIHFNLEGIDWGRFVRDAGGYTNWELRQVFKNWDLLRKTKFYNRDKMTGWGNVFF
jgi:hypothetical protein